MASDQRSSMQPPSGSPAHPFISFRLSLNSYLQMVSRLRHIGSAVAALAALACTPLGPTATITPAGPTTAAISTADLRHRMEIVAHDSMMGRESGTIYNDKATDYIAAEAARIGLLPAGDAGSFFQRLPLVRRVFAAANLTTGGRTFTMWQDFLPRDQGPGMRQISGAPTIFGGVWTGDATALVDPAQTRDRLVVIRVGQGWIANRILLTGRYRDAAGVIVASLDAMDATDRAELSTPGVGMIPAGTPTPLPAFLYSTLAMAEASFGRPLTELNVGATGTPFVGQITLTQEPAPGARNVIAVLPGSDPALRGQYVVIGSHNDHVGFNRRPVDHDSLRAFNRVVRPAGADNPMRQPTAQEWVRIRAILDSLRAVRPPRPDSIFNGADDDGSGIVAMLEMAEAFVGAATRPRRSLLFVWHTAEESGLIGAQYFTDNPTVARDSMVAMINLDMIGRGMAHDIAGGGMGYLQAIGSRRLSTEIGRLVDEVAGQMSPRIELDYQYDAPRHPQQFYCRSDHYMYARYGIPVAFFSTGGHPDYHQVTDETQYISFEKLAHVTRFVHTIAERLAMQPARPVVDQPRPDPHAPCVQ
jgi:hypothetical protein